MLTTGMLMGYDSGVMTEQFLHCSNPGLEVNHGITLVGYGEVKDEQVRGHCKHYWIIRNSWGDDWGENGFFKLCADDPFSEYLPYGTCHVNKYGTWPTM
jgi:hypothetical protein